MMIFLDGGGCHTVRVLVAYPSESEPWPGTKPETEGYKIGYRRPVKVPTRKYADTRPRHRELEVQAHML